MFLSKCSQYYYVYYTNPLTGRRTKVTTKSKNKRDAYKFLINFTESKKPKVIKLTLEEFKIEYLKYARIHYVKSSVTLYERSLNHLNEITGNILINYIHQDQIEKYKSIRLSTGISKATVNMEFRALKAIFNTSITWGLLISNPCIGVKQFRLPQKEILAFTEIEINTICDSIADKPLKNIVLFALYTGCRLNEILHLQWRDIDFANKILTIKNKPNFKTKTGSIRLLPISNKLINQLELLYSKESKINNETYIFRKIYNIPFNGNYISKSFKKELRRLCFPERYHFHCLRHTFITQLARKGVNIYDIKQLAGHSDIKTTELYMHNITEDLRKAVNLI